MAAPTMAVSAKPPMKKINTNSKRRHLFTRPPPDDANDKHQKEISEEIGRT
jgi:hypothetical protein